MSRIGTTQSPADDECTNIGTLLRTVADDREDESVSHAAGESLAEILFRRGQLDAAPLHDFTGAAYIGFDETIARLQREAR